MVSSAKSFRMGHGVADSALVLQHQCSGPDDSSLTKISMTDREHTSPGGADPAAPSATPSADALDAEWDSVIDAATD